MRPMEECRRYSIFWRKLRLIQTLLRHTLLDSDILGQCFKEWLGWTFCKRKSVTPGINQTQNSTNWMFYEESSVEVLVLWMLLVPVGREKLDIDQKSCRTKSSCGCSWRVTTAGGSAWILLTHPSHLSGLETRWMITLACLGALAKNPRTQFRVQGQPWWDNDLNITINKTLPRSSLLNGSWIE